MTTIWAACTAAHAEALGTAVPDGTAAASVVVAAALLLLVAQLPSRPPLASGVELASFLDRGNQRRGRSLRDLRRGELRSSYCADMVRLINNENTIVRLIAPRAQIRLKI